MFSRSSLRAACALVAAAGSLAVAVPASAKTLDVVIAGDSDRFVGHEPNQNPYVDNRARWVNEFDLAGPYHPNDAGYNAKGEAVFAASGAGFDFGVSQ